MIESFVVLVFKIESLSTNHAVASLQSREDCLLQEMFVCEARGAEAQDWHHLPVVENNLPAGPH